MSDKQIWLVVDDVIYVKQTVTDEAFEAIYEALER